MFRGINVDNKSLDITIELWKNKNEILGIIDNSFCKEIIYTFGEPTQLELEIPKFIMKNNEKVINNLYNKIKIRQQVIVDVNGEKERFIITDVSLKLEKRKGIKSLTAYSFEKTLENKRISFLDTVTRTLVKDDLYIHDGLLDEVQKVSGWTIGYVDDDAKMITEMANENIHINLFETYTNNKIEEEGLIWEKDITTDVEDQYAVNIQIDYLGLKTYDENSKLLKTEQLSNELKPLYTNIKHVKAYHHSETGNRYGIKYIITLIDDVEIEQIHTFTNVVNKKIIVDNINLIYETGKIVEGRRAKFISIDGTNDNILSFMKVLQEQFNCVFKYDTINKIIHCYSKDNIGEDKPIELSYDTNVISVDATPNNEVPNCLDVEGNDGLSISSENPYGGDRIYNYSYYIENDYLPSETIVALEKYEKLLTIKQEEYYTLKNAISDLQSLKTKYDSQISSLEYRIKYSYNLLTAFISAESSDPQQEVLRNEISELEAKLNECVRERTSLQEQILSIEEDMVKISEEIQRSKAVDSNGNNIFTDNDLEILDDIEYSVIYEDSYYTTSYGLYNNSVKKLEEMIKPQVEFDISCSNLAKVIKNKLKNIIELGSFFMVNTDEIPELKEDKVRFIGYSLTPSEKKIGNLKFTNKEFKNENLNFASNVGRKTTKSTNTIKTFKDVWEDARLSNDYVNTMITEGLSLATTQINARTSRTLIDFSEAGCYLWDANNKDDGNAIYFGSNLICVSQDSFKTSNVAISGDGIIAEMVLGRLLLGAKVEVSTPDGLFVIGNNGDNTRMGLHVSDDVSRDRIFLGLERQENGTQKAKLELRASDGKTVVLSEDGIISYSQFVVWDNLSKDFPMKIPYKSDEGIFSNKRIVMSLYFDKYRAFERGLSSGGTVQTTVSGGGGTSGAGGYHHSSSTKTSQAQNWLNAPYQGYFKTSLEYAYIDDGTGEQHHYHVQDASLFSHKHDTVIEIEVPEHHHSTPDHSHDLDTTHNHELQYAIHEQDSMCSNVRVYVNDVLVMSGINNDTDVDITNYININRNNMIRIETDTNGRITVNFQNKVFQGW